MIEFKMPALGSDMDEGTLDEWLVKPGDKVTRGQVVAVVETTKAAVEVECWHEGTVHELLVPVGETVAVGTVLAPCWHRGRRRSDGRRSRSSPPPRPRRHRMQPHRPPQRRRRHIDAVGSRQPRAAWQYRWVLTLKP